MSQSRHLPQRLVGDLVKEIRSVLPLAPELPPPRLEQFGGQVVYGIVGAVGVGGQQGPLKSLGGGHRSAGHLGWEGVDTAKDGGWNHWKERDD